MKRSLKTAFATLSACAALAFGAPAFAQDASAFTTSDGSVSITMPCEAPIDFPAGAQGLEGRVCMMDAFALVFVSSSNMSDIEERWYSDFDMLVDDVSTSNAMGAIDQLIVDGRRELHATQNPSDGFGEVRAIEMSDQHVVYVGAFSPPGTTGGISSQERAVVDRFFDSVQVAGR